jgi:hypothetical protein
VPHTIKAVTDASVLIGSALVRKQDEIDRGEITALLEQMKSYDPGSGFGQLLRAREEGILQEGDVQRLFAKPPRPKFHGLTECLNELYFQMFFCDVEKAAQEALDDGSLPRDAYDLIVRSLSPQERGRRFREAVEWCSRVVKDFKPGPDASAEIMHRLAERSLARILKELERLGILGICEYSLCRRTFYPSKPNKRYCSMALEGRDCSANARSSRHYRKKSRCP